MFNKNTLENMRVDINQALELIAEKYNCEVHAGNVKYDNVTATFSVSFDKKGSDEMSAEQNLFNTYCELYGFDSADYFRAVVLDNKTYRFVGFNIRARKNFCIIERNGKKYSCSIDTIKSNWKD